MHSYKTTVDCDTKSCTLASTTYAQHALSHKTISAQSDRLHRYTHL